MGKAIEIKLTGDEALTRILNAGAAQSAKAIGAALLEEARLVMRESLDQVPVKDGFLKASAEVKDPKFSNGLIKVTMGYGGAASAYALYQHNAPSGFHYTKSGSKSHFLSDPLQAATPRIAKNLTTRIGRLLQTLGA